MTFVALRPMIAEVNWEGFHHRDRWSSLLSNCRMVFAEKVSEQVVTMMAPETIVEARE
jgi:predicted ABC-class ATPase